MLHETIAATSAGEILSELTHFDESGASRMVSIAAKESSARMARAEAIVEMQPSTLQMILDRKISKGDVREVARLAGIMATKRTSELIPLCHLLGLESAEVNYQVIGDDQLRIESRVSTHGKTGVEMEALTAVSVAALTIYDMCKSVDRGMEIRSIRLLEKRGGKSGHFLREDLDSKSVTAS